MSNNSTLTVYMYCCVLSLNQLMSEKKCSCSQIIVHFPKTYYQYIVQGTFPNHFRDNCASHYSKSSEFAEKLADFAGF